MHELRLVGGHDRRDGEPAPREDQQSASRETKRLKFRSNANMPSIVGIATAVAHGNASNAVHVNDWGFRNARPSTTRRRRRAEETDGYTSDEENDEDETSQRHQDNATAARPSVWSGAHPVQRMSMKSHASESGWSSIAIPPAGSSANPRVLRTSRAGVFRSVRRKFSHKVWASGQCRSMRCRKNACSRNLPWTRHESMKS